MTMMERAHDVFQGYRFAGKTEENGITILEIRNETGNGTMRCYTVLPGITLSFNSLCMETCYQQVRPVHGFLNINYCKKGCYEFELKDGERYFLGENDLIISNPEYAVITNSWLPQTVYEGISLMVDINTAREWISTQATWLHFDLNQLRQNVSCHGVVKLIDTRKKIQQFFDDLYTLPAQAENPDSILKVLEILRYLSKIDQNDTVPLEHFSPAVIQATEEVHCYLTNILPECKLTVNELCCKFHVSKTSFQHCFKSLYGWSPAEYIRRKRIDLAAKQILKHPKMTIAEVAMQVGYENPSKFSAAFCAVMHERPLEYRKRRSINALAHIEQKYDHME